MRKPVHWSKENKGHENRTIVSSLYLLKLDVTLFLSLYTNLSEEEKDSVMWGIWEEEKKKLRPHVYSLQNAMCKLLIRLYNKKK